MPFMNIERIRTDTSSVRVFHYKGGIYSEVIKSITSSISYHVSCNGRIWNYYTSPTFLC